jgi:hypothetical protein
MGDCMAGFKIRTRVGYYLPAVLLKIFHYFTNTVEVPQQCNIFSKKKYNIFKKKSVATAAFAHHDAIMNCLSDLLGRVMTSY